jgi:hypothetical protein
MPLEGGVVAGISKPADDGWLALTNNIALLPCPPSRRPRESSIFGRRCRPMRCALNNCTSSSLAITSASACVLGHSRGAGAVVEAAAVAGSSRRCCHGSPGKFRPVHRLAACPFRGLNRLRRIVLRQSSRGWQFATRRCGAGSGRYSGLWTAGAADFWRRH